MPEMTNEQILADRKEGFGNPEEKTTEPVEAKETPVIEPKEAEDTSTEDLSVESETTDEDSGDLEGTVEVDADAEESEEKSEELEDAVSKLTKKDKEPGWKKRIDKLTAEKYRLEAELALLKEKKQEPSKTAKSYTEEQLSQAERKAIADNDLELLAEVNKERLKNVKNSLVEQYENEKKQALQTQTARQKQWTTIVDRYSNDDDPAMDIRNVNSELYKVAKAYFEDPELSSEYSGPRGMLQAVADAFVELSRTKRKQQVRSPKEKKLEQKLIKEKRKSSLGKPSHDRPTTPPQSKKENSGVMDYINERKADLAKRQGTLR